jgi:hypothetical protein
MYNELNIFAENEEKFLANNGINLTSKQISKIKKVAFNVLEELKKPKYKLTFRSEKNTLKYIHPIDYRYDAEKIRTLTITPKTILFRMEVLNNGTTHFNDCPIWSQGEIWSFNLNGDSKYFIAVNGTKAEIVGIERKNYGGGIIVQRTPFKFKINK